MYTKIFTRRLLFLFAANIKLLGHSALVLGSSYNGTSKAILCSYYHSLNFYEIVQIILKMPH